MAAFKRYIIRQSYWRIIFTAPFFLLFCSIPVSLQNTIDTPVGVSAVAISESAIEISWNDASKDVEGFIVERTTEPNRSKAEWIQVIDTMISPYVDPDLTSSTVYYYRIMAYNSKSKSYYSDIVSASTEKAGKKTPDSPSQLTVSSVTSSSIELIWNDNSDNELGFKVYRTEGASDQWHLRTTVQGNIESFTDNNGLAENVTYNYKVCAYNQFGHSTYSNQITGVTSVDIPAIPSDLAAVTESSTSIKLTWSDNSNNETGFRIYISTDGTGFSTLKDVTVNSKGTLCEGLDPETIYYFRVAAFNNVHFSDNSNTANETTDPATVGIPTKPSNLTVSDKTLSSVTLSWTDNSVDETGFLLERSTDIEDWISIYVDSGSGLIEYTDEGLDSFTTYHYRVSAYNTAGNSGSSNVVTITTESENSGSAIIADHNVARLTKLMSISDADILNAKSKLHIAYTHTSHGSQITTGMTGLASWKGSLYSYNNGGTGGALDLYDYAMGSTDLGSDWYTATRNFLGTSDPSTGRGTGANADVNVIVWSWCGQVSYQTEQNIINNYLTPMSQLENDYPGIKFIYMTGHLDGSGLNGNLHIRNEQIRQYCKANNKILFDFADIETYDPDGTYYGDKHPTDACNYDNDNSGTTSQTSDSTAQPISPDRNWATDWQGSHILNVDWYNCASEHSQPLNANMKAYAFWWLLTQIAD